VAMCNAYPDAVRANALGEREHPPP
jgi:hypothetical protein